MSVVSRTVLRLAAGLERLIRLAAQHAAAAILVILVSGLALHLSGFASLPTTDRDEARYVQATTQMLESGDFIDIRFQDEARHKKPIGIYWLQAAAVALLGEAGAREMWVYRLPSLLGALAAGVLTWWVARPLTGRLASLLAGLLMTACVILGVEARLAKTDAVLLATILAAQGILARVWKAGTRGADPPAGWLIWAFWVALGVSILIKGPIGPLVVGLTMLALCLVSGGWRWLGTLRPGRGVLVASVVAAPWLIAITIVSEGAFWIEAVQEDLLGKVAEGQESHGAPPGYYTALVWLTFWPGALILALALPALWLGRREAVVQFCLAWVLPTWILFELVVTKLPHYVLPTYPALAILAASAWVYGPERAFGGGRRTLAVVFLAIAPILIATAIGLSLYFEGRLPWTALGWLVASLAVARLVWTALAAGLRAGAVGGLVILAGVVHAGVYPALAGIGYFWPSAQAAAMIPPAATACANPARITARYIEPSIVFVTDRRLARMDGAAAAAALAEADCGFALVEDREQAAFLEQFPEAVPIGRVDGLNFGGGTEVRLTVYVAPLERPEAD